MRLSATGVPKVLLDDRRAFAYDGRMRCWMQITYDELRGSVHCASAGMPIRPLANGERALERGVGDRGGGRRVMNHAGVFTALAQAC